MPGGQPSAALRAVRSDPMLKQLGELSAPLTENSPLGGVHSVLSKLNLYQVGLMRFQEEENILAARSTVGSRSSVGVGGTNVTQNVTVPDHLKIEQVPRYGFLDFGNAVSLIANQPMSNEVQGGLSLLAYGQESQANRKSLLWRKLGHSPNADFTRD